MISIACNITLSLLFSQLFGISGVALATSIAMLIATILLAKNVKKYLPDFSVKNCFSEIRKGIVSLILSIGALVMIKNAVKFNILISLIIEGTVVVVVYCIMLFCLKSESIREILDFIKKRA